MTSWLRKKLTEIIKKVQAEPGRVVIVLLFIMLVSAVSYALSMQSSRMNRSQNADLTGGQSASNGTNASGTIEETPNFETSNNPDYWLNSGGEAYIEGSSTLASIHGDLASGSRWQTEYAETNSTDTDGGLHPQNLFRLFTTQSYGDGAYSAYVKIDKILLSASQNRNESNGAFLMIHAKDSDNLYYAGLRVDGSAVIKKKVNGTYYTLAEVPVFAYAAYDKNGMPNLLPLGAWLGMKADVHTLSDDRVEIIFSIDIGGSGNWIPLMHVIDAGTAAAPTLPSPGHAGIRTDFMEMEIKDFKVESL